MVAWFALSQKMNLAALNRALRPHALTVFGVLRGDAGTSIAMIGPSEPGFWAHFEQSPEWRDGMDDAMDRWSKRVLDGVAQDLGAQAHFPFGADAKPFLTWALRSNGAWQSPVGLLVGQVAGLMVSYRGALEFDHAWGVDEQETPCTACAAPCKTACPVGALTPAGYDVEKCRDYLRTDAGAPCLNGGCLVRKSCPVSQKYQRVDAQSAYHMRLFRDG